MSLEVLQNFSGPPLKRPRETITDVIKCGEILVTSCGDKWTFDCSHCELSTSDIGVFVCHIRFDHLKDQLELLPQERKPPNEQAPQRQSNIATTIAPSLLSDANTTPIMTKIHIAGVFNTEELATNTDEQLPHSEIIKEETALTSNVENFEPICSKVSKIVDISSLTQPECDETVNIAEDKNFITTTQHFPSNINEEFFNTNDDKAEQNPDTSNRVEEKDHVENNSETNSCSSPSEDDDENEDNNKNCANDDDDSDLETQGRNAAGKLKYDCPYCNLSCKTKSGQTYHIKKRHDKNYGKHIKYRCEQCRIDFKTRHTYKFHLRSHNENNKVQCPVCHAKLDEYKLISHVLKHEGPTCFPCQVCGKIFVNNDERRAHWITHAEELPFNCDICFRRFKKIRFLVCHMKVHKQYQCSFCPEQFQSKDFQRAPFVCPKCELIPDRMKQVEHQRAVLEIKHTFESDETSNDEDNSEKDSNSLDNNDNDDNGNELNDVIELDEDDDDDNIVVNEADGDSDLEFLDDTKDDNVASGSGVQIQAERYMCKYCSRDFPKRKGLRAHIAQMHRAHYIEDTNFAFKCSYCSKGFQSRSGFLFHLKTHNKSMYQFKCTLCPYETFRPHDFSNHLMTHESVDCFPCLVCGKILPTKDERLTHWNSHAEDTPFGCTYCFRRFRKTHNLQNHLKTHNVYYCNFCPEIFQADKTVEPPYVCPKCVENKKSSAAEEKK